MDLQQKVSFLKEIDLFSHLSSDQLDHVASITQEKAFLKDDYIIEEGETADCACIIIDGSVKVFRLTEDGKEIPLNILSRGHILGEMALLDGGTRSASVVALTPVKILLISSTAFHDLLKKYPSITLNLMAILSKKLRASDAHYEQAMTTNIVERTYHTLQTLAKSHDTKTLSMTHEELATLIGITRPRLTEALHTLQDEGKISLAQKEIHLL